MVLVRRLPRRRHAITTTCSGSGCGCGLLGCCIDVVFELVVVLLLLQLLQLTMQRAELSSRCHLFFPPLSFVEWCGLFCEDAPFQRDTDMRNGRSKLQNWFLFCFVVEKNSNSTRMIPSPASLHARFPTHVFFVFGCFSTHISYFSMALSISTPDLRMLTILYKHRSCSRVWQRNSTMVDAAIDLPSADGFGPR